MNKIPLKLNTKKIIQGTLKREFSNSILSNPAKIVPDCFLDLQPYLDENGGQVKLAAIGNEIRALPDSALTEFLLPQKSIGLYIPQNYCTTRTFVEDNPSQVQKNISELSDIGDVHSLIFKNGNKYLGYAVVISKEVRAEIENQFSFYLQNGGAIISIQNRRLPLTQYMMKKAVEIEPKLVQQDSFLFCEVEDYITNVWILLNVVGEKEILLCPMTNESISSTDESKIQFIISSAITQASKAYGINPPNKAVIMDNRQNKSVSVLESFQFSFETEDLVIISDSKKGGYML